MSQHTPGPLSKCLNCGQLERLHGDPLGSIRPHPVCDDFEPDHEAVAERQDWERYPKEGG